VHVTGRRVIATVIDGLSSWDLRRHGGGLTRRRSLGDTMPAAGTVAYAVVVALERVH
jgi:hypothetical protein